MELTTAMILLLVAAVIGVIVGWVLGSRSAAQARAERDARETEYKQAIAELAVATERVHDMRELRETLDEVTRERDEARLENAKLSTLAASFEQQFNNEKAGYERRLAEFKADREQLTAQFREIGATVLTDAQKTFLERADQRFAEAGTTNETKIKALLAPVETTLKRYEEGLAQVERQRIDSYADLRRTVEEVKAGQGQVREETAKLVNALRSSPKARGRWGEQSLKNVLEQAGLSPFADFQQEVVVGTDDGTLRPDVIVRLPGGRKLVIDAKCSLNAYLDAADAIEEVARREALKAHASSVRTHVQQLSAKSYWDKFGDAADYVVMYIPGEHFQFAAFEQDPELWQWACDRRVLITTPTSLIALARMIALEWRQQGLIEDARKVDALGKELHERLAVAATHLKRVGGGLNSAVENYNRFVSSFDTRVMASARKFKGLNVGLGSKELEPLETVDALAKPSLTEVPLLSAAAVEEGEAEAEAA